MVSNLPAIQETQVWFLGQVDPLEKGMATHSSILAWRIPWTEEPGGLQSMGSKRVGHNWPHFWILLFYWVLRIFSIFWVLISIEQMIYKYFLPFCGLPFHPVDIVSWCTTFTNFHELQFVCCFFCRSCLVVYPRKTHQIQWHESLALCVLRDL